MKMMYNGTQIKSLNVNHYEMNTNDCDMIASDLQAGKTAVARGKKIIGTGRTFEFAQYGSIETNTQIYIPSNINIIEVASLQYPIKSNISFGNIGNVNFEFSQVVANVNINGSNVEILAQAKNNFLVFTCSETIKLEVFYGKDRYL